MEQISHKVIHTTFRRIRILIPRLAKDSGYARQLNTLVKSLDFVTSVRINTAARSLIVNSEARGMDSAELQEPIFRCIQQASQVETPPEPQASEMIVRPDINYWERLSLPLLSLGLALAFEPLGVPIPFVAIAGAIFIAALPTITNSFDNVVKHQELNAGLLDSMWTILHTLNGEFVAPSLAVTLAESSGIMRDLTSRASERQNLDLLGGLGEYWVQRNGQRQRLPIQQLQQEDIIIVSVGDSIPVDGSVIKGSALIDQQYLTGESKPVACSEGEVVYASSMVIQGQLFIQAEEVGDQTRAGQIFELMQAAPVYDTRIGDYAEETANQVVVPSIFASGVVFALTGNATRAIAPLQLDFAVGIGITVPTAILAALNYAARTGVYIRSGRALELLSRIDTIVFDKTGTLTEPIGTIVAIETIAPEVSSDEVLALAASAEQYVNHPIAQSIISHASEIGLETPQCDTWDYELGGGVTAQINGQKILVGNSRWMQEQEIDIDVIYMRTQEAAIRNRSVCYVARDRELLGIIVYSNPVRKESASVIRTLRDEKGISSLILTGDNHRAASGVAYKVGISLGNTYAGAFPERKVAVLRNLKDQGNTVAYVGDGINDSAGLAYADVSISFARGSDIARETADVVLMDNDLRGLPHAIDIAKEAMEIVHQNIAIVAIPNISVVLAGALFGLNPVLAVIISNGSTLIAELNALRLLLGEDRKDRELKPEVSSAKTEEGLLGVPWYKRPRQAFEGL
ncbi:MAG: heavy metal translocating P-type ATPase [Xenococcaceae cyanobacterium]